MTSSPALSEARTVTQAWLTREIAALSAIEGARWWAGSAHERSERRHRVGALVELRNCLAVGDLVWVGLDALADRLAASTHTATVRDIESYARDVAADLRPRRN